MRRKAVLFAVMFILPVLASGCTVKAERVLKETPVMEARNNDKPPSTAEKYTKDKPAAKKYKDEGVIIETVVDVFRSPDTKSERVTQALYNQRVEIMEKQSGWYKVKVVDGYTGWIKAKYIDEDCSSIRGQNFKYRLIVTSKMKKVYSGAGSGISLKDVAMGTELFATAKEKGYYSVNLPKKLIGWVNESGVIQLDLDEEIPKTTAQDFLITAGKLNGTSYLWGGISARGVDCSGLTYISARINGVILPRDADQQFRKGEKVKPVASDMKPGDLVFFSSNTDLKDISHVGIYTGNNQFLHASKSKAAVVTGSLEDNYFKQRLVGVRRIF